MLKRLSLTNFQTHRRFVLDLHNRITTVVGASDVGKSTILRSLRWVALNQFDGPADEFISWGKDFAQVRLDFDKGRSLVRRKGDHNFYKLDGKTFKAFGAGKVPPEITSALAVAPINFQQQLDSHFWFSETPGEVSRQLNSIVNLGTIDAMLSSIGSELIQAKATVRVSVERVTSIRTEVKSLAFVPEVERSLARLERQQKRIQSLGPQGTRLRELISSVSEQQSDAQNAGEVILRGRKLLARGADALALRSRAKKLRKLLADVEHAQTLVRTSVPALPSTLPLERLAKRRERLASILYRLNEQKEILCRATNVCPTCKRPLPSPSL